MPVQGGGAGRAVRYFTREISAFTALVYRFVQRLEPAASFFPPYWRCLGFVKGACAETLSCGAQSARCRPRSTR